MAYVSLEILQRIAPETETETLEGFVSGLRTQCDVFEINNISRLSCFLSQIAKESSGFVVIEEDLNYTAKELRKTFPKHFKTDEIASEYEKQPEKIANRIYANRMGNGDEESGDGFKYRGRGLFQITGLNNYTAFAEDTGLTIDEAIAYLQTSEGASMAAAWFWWKNKLNDLADHEDMLNLTKRINGGTIGLQDRIHHFEIVKGALQTQI